MYSHHRNRDYGFTLIEMALYVGLAAGLFATTIGIKNAYVDSERTEVELSRFSVFIKDATGMRDQFAGDYSTINSNTILLYGGDYLSSDIVMIGGKNRLQANLGSGSYYDVTPYIVAGVPKGFIASVTVTDKAMCFDFLSRLGSVTQYAEKIELYPIPGAVVVAQQVVPPIDSFVDTAAAVCSAASGRYGARIYINTMISDGTIKGLI